MKSLKLFVCFYCLLFNTCILIPKSFPFSCYLPEKCHFMNIFTSPLYDKEEEITNYENYDIMCDIDDFDKFEFKFVEPTPLINNQSTCDSDKLVNEVIFRWTKPKESTILDNRLNFSYVYRYFTHFRNQAILARFWGLRGFDLNIVDDIYVSSPDYSIEQIQFSNCRLDFYRKNKKVNSCEDIIKSNISHVYSVFHLNKVGVIIFKNLEYKQKICPPIFLVFQMKLITF